MKNVKNAVLLLLIALLFVAAGCSNQGSADGEGKAKETIKIGMSFQEMNNPYFISIVSLILYSKFGQLLYLQQILNFTA